MKEQDATESASASAQIDQRISGLGDWRGETLARMRALIHEADANVVETWKWMGTPVWECNGIICTGESYKDKVKLTFAKGASVAILPDFSTRASKAMRAARLIFTRVKRSIPTRSKR